MIRRPPRSTPLYSSAASDVYKRQVDNLESEVIRLLDFLDLPFEESCVRFYETDRSVRTPSSEQVRKPVNKAGMGRWKPYAKNLKLLIDNLDSNLLKNDDIKLINSLQ